MQWGYWQPFDLLVSFWRHQRTSQYAPFLERHFHSVNMTKVIVLWANFEGYS